MQTHVRLYSMVFDKVLYDVASDPEHLLAIDLSCDFGDGKYQGLPDISFPLAFYGLWRESHCVELPTSFVVILSSKRESIKFSLIEHVL